MHAYAHTHNALQLAAAPPHLIFPQSHHHNLQTLHLKKSRGESSRTHSSTGRSRSLWEAKGNGLIFLPTLCVFVSVLLLPRRPRLRTGPLSPTAPARPLHVAAQSPAPRQKLHSHAGSLGSSLSVKCLILSSLHGLLFHSVPGLLNDKPCPREAQSCLCLGAKNKDEGSHSWGNHCPHHPDWPYSSPVHGGHAARECAQLGTPKGPVPSKWRG